MPPLKLRKDPLMFNRITFEPILRYRWNYNNYTACNEFRAT